MKKYSLYVVLFFTVLISLLYSAFAEGGNYLMNNMSDVYGNNGPGGFGGMSMSQLALGLLFGVIGFSAIIYGKKEMQIKPMLIGVALIGISYFLKDWITLSAAGIILTAFLFLFND